jgi:hypothetical protein
MMLFRNRFPVLLAALWLAGCSSPETEWQEARQDGSEDALLTYIQKYPESPQAAEARRMIVEMSIAADWQMAESAGSPQAYEAFLEKHPDSVFAGVAASRATGLRARVAWESLRDSSDAQALEAFAAEFAEAPEAELARARLAELAAPPAPEPAAAPAVPPARAAPAPRAPAATAPRAPSAPAAGATHRVQFGAYAAQAAANAERERLAGRLAAVLGGTGLEVQAAGGMHRVVTVAVSERQARELCASAKAAGAECFVRAL